MCLQHTNRPSGPRGGWRTDRCPARHGGPLGAARNAEPLPDWLAREIGVSPGYISMLVNGERAPSGRIRRRMLRALGVSDFRQLFRMEDTDDDP